MTQQELPAPLAEMTGLMAECANNGDFAGAARQANELVTLCRATLGERNPSVLELKVALATLQLRAGDHAVVYADLEGWMPDLVEVLGRDHLSTLTARHLLAGRQQPPLSSLSEWSQLLVDEQRILGAEHESTLVVREKVAEKRWEIGDFGRRDGRGSRRARGPAAGARRRSRRHPRDAVDAGDLARQGG
jgi:hypothetical protein